MPRSADREAMVERQLRARGITDERVLEAMRRVPREAFVPAALRDRAYDDVPLPLGEGQTISQPFVVATMCEHLALTGHETVLEVGAGSGYAAAILDELAAEVVAIELLPGLADRARRALAATGHGGVDLRTGDGRAGAPDRAPYDAVLVSAAAVDVPEALVDQLAQGGRLVAPVGDRVGQRLLLVERTPSGVRRSLGLPCRFVPLLGGDTDPSAGPATLARRRWRIRR